MVQEPSSETNESSLGHVRRRRFLKGSAGVAAGVAAIPALSGVAAAHFPVELDIDVQPDNADNFIDLDEHEYVSVAVFPSEYLSDGEKTTFDPTKKDVRYRFGSRSALDDGKGARPVGDGEVKEMTTGHGDEKHTTEVLVLKFPVNKTGLEEGNDTAWLFWERDESGEHGLSGVDTVSVYGGDPSVEDLLALIRRLLRALSKR